ncbi:hypothetical protein CPJCM30710_10310 [Clostridium polyendosporum]|uniref:Uncharacterized protein n=1 Tax=Clostridium polyendosporum TaxID=69208 RepID=A0A919VFF4_9CLOT|nr:hypothetical protein [Clostridium polyendosporum]GIM28365.1 hypothetical protein CPJCM30710_10310 [Clostridium polyendosporum]
MPTRLYKEKHRENEKMSILKLSENTHFCYKDLGKMYVVLIGKQAVFNEFKSYTEAYRIVKDFIDFYNI